MNNPMLIDVAGARARSDDYMVLSSRILDKSHNGKYFLWHDDSEQGSLSEGQIAALKANGFYVRAGCFVFGEWMRGQRMVFDRYGALIYWGCLNFEFLDRLDNKKFGDFISELNRC